MGSDKLIGVKTLAEWQAFARTDRCLNAMVPSDLRLILQEVASLRSALERCVQVLELCDTIGEPHPTHDAVIAGLSKVCGAGPLMKALVNEWRGHLRLIHDLTSPSANHFTVGPTRDSVEGALRVGRAALGAQHDQRDDAGERPEAGDDRQGGFAPAGTGC